MRRLLAILLLLVSASPLVTPLFAQSTGATVAVCCRRGGDHHCMALALTESKGISIHARCPAMHGASLPSHMQVFALAQPVVRSSEKLTQPAVLAQVEATYRISFCRSRQKRGPPTIA